MSLVHEIHNQKPAVRYMLFGLSLVIICTLIGFYGVTALQRNMFMALHTDTGERDVYLASQDAKRPKPIAALARLAGSFSASIGSFIGWDRDAGFDRGGQQDTMQGGVHLLPLSE